MTEQRFKHLLNEANADGTMADRGTLSQRNAEIERGYNNMRRLIVFTGSAVALTCIALVLISWSSPSMADQKKDDGGKSQQGRKNNHAPAVQWNPPTVNASVLAGTTTQLAVTLTTSAPIPATRVLISKRLRSFVTVSPAALGAMPAGSVVTLTLTVSSAITATPTMTSGFLKLRESREATATDDVFCDGQDGDVRLARPLPVSVAVTWQTISVPNGPKGIVYPATWGVEVTPDRVIRISGQVNATPAVNDEDLGGTCKVVVRANSNPTLWSIDQWVQKLHLDEGSVGIASSSQITINGFTGIEENSDEIGSTKTVYLPTSATTVMSFQLLCGDTAAQEGTSIFSNILTLSTSH